MSQHVAPSPRASSYVADDQAAPGGRNAYQRLLARLEQAEVLDRPVEAAGPFARSLVSRRSMRRFLHGDATGIPIHVILTDVPLGAWWMAMFLDHFPDGSSQRSATRLVGLGVVASAPTAAAGWAEWALADHPTQRVGVVHAAVNGATVLIFLASWVARARDHHVLGARLTKVGGAATLVGSSLGGHMSSGRRGSA